MALYWVGDPVENPRANAGPKRRNWKTNIRLSRTKARKQNVKAILWGGGRMHLPNPGQNPKEVLLSLNLGLE